MSKVTIQLISLFACTKVVVVITTITRPSQKQVKPWVEVGDFVDPKICWFNLSLFGGGHRSRMDVRAFVGMSVRSYR
jgi:hypothetical protein